MSEMRYDPNGLRFPPMPKIPPVPPRRKQAENKGTMHTDNIIKLSAVKKQRAENQDEPGL